MIYDKNKTIMISVSAVFSAAVLFFLFKSFGSGGPSIFRQDSERRAGSGESAAVKKYVNTGYGFSFSYPSDWEVSYSNDRAGKTIMARKAADPGQSFRVFIQPFDEPEGSLSKQRISRDLPGSVVENERYAEMAEGVRAFIFNGSEGGVETQEVWFVRGGYLYQAAAPVENREALQNAINSWEFGAASTTTP